jgi:DNA-binding transcriptional regulator GbsR (MarR family)
MGRVWTLLFLRGEPLSAAEVCDELAISAGAASMTLSELEHWGVVRRLRQPGSRREYFEAETDVWRMISRVLRERELMQIERALEVFDRVREQLVRSAAPGDRQRLEEISERIARLADLARMGKGFLSAVVAQGKVDLAPLMRFARPRRS